MRIVIAALLLGIQVLICIEAPASPNARSLFDSKALLEAAIGEHTEAVQFLLTSGAQTHKALGA